MPDLSAPPPGWNHPVVPPIRMSHAPMQRMGHPPMPMNFQYHFGPQGMQQIERAQNYGYIGKYFLFHKIVN